MSEASALIRQTLEECLPSPLHVVGEVSGLSVRSHWYFSLKDEGAVLSCVAWASTAERFGFVPRDGEEVLATGHVSHYGPQGRTQFYVSRLTPVGAGALAARFRALCEELRRLGYFDEERKQPLPAFPRRIAVITSRQGAALQDVLDTARRRCPAVAILVVDVRVQGEGAAEQVARAIQAVDRRRADLGVDAILLTRGGGSVEDLWTFNERVVADAIFRCQLPVVAAIGHESDVTVAELVADVRAATPTQAAMRLVPDAAALRRQLDHLGARLTLLVRRLFEQRRSRLESLARHELLRSPAALIERQRERCRLLARHLPLAAAGLVSRRRTALELAAARLARSLPADVRAARGRLEGLADRLGGGVRRRRELAAASLAGLERQLRSVDPQRVLARGYSMTFDAEGVLVRRAAQATPGARLRTVVADGSFSSVVEGPAPSQSFGEPARAPSGPAAAGAAARPEAQEDSQRARRQGGVARRGAKHRAPGDQGGLFEEL